MHMVIGRKKRKDSEQDCEPIDIEVATRIPSEHSQEHPCGVFRSEFEVGFDDIGEVETLNPYDFFKRRWKISQDSYRRKLDCDGNQEPHACALAFQPDVRDMLLEPGGESGGDYWQMALESGLPTRTGNQHVERIGKSGIRQRDRRRSLYTTVTVCRSTLMSGTPFVASHCKGNVYLIYHPYTLDTSYPIAVSCAPHRTGDGASKSEKRREVRQVYLEPKVNNQLIVLLVLHCPTSLKPAYYLSA
ncbi:hypothetical protein M422DRAFT_276452 [Sphaerobolus stellatus SS14]|uniref:Uncharacterized protein n=1 Tax=Sphaerobolus stellatus (strain SS14) TaxID=990650 RepID=A0A0C9TMI3_SPHS4|nr:hypothetical protein M422DRAFT_276452 [Sphaerobolus stellatus SS14]